MDELPSNLGRFQRRVVALAALTIAGAIGAFAFFTSSRDLDAEIARAELEVGYQAQMFEVFTRNLFGTYDQALLMLRGEAVQDGPPQDLRDWVRRRGLLRQPLFQLALVGPDGRLIATTEGPQSVGIDLSDREHIRVHFRAEADTLFVSRPLIGRASGRASINITRAIRDDTGSFLGVVVASVDPASFSVFLEQIKNRDTSVVTLVGLDGVIRARSGAVPAAQTAAGQPPRLALFDRLADNPSGVYRARSGVDGIERIYAYRTLADHNVVVVVGTEVAPILRALASRHWRVALISGLAILVVFGVAILIDRVLLAEARLRIDQAVARDRELRNRELSRILDECGALLVQLDERARMAGCNDAFVAAFAPDGREALLGRSIDEVLAGGNVSAPGAGLAEQIADLGAEPRKLELTAMSARGDRRDLLWIWTKGRSSDGQADRYLGIAIDNTDLRANELKLIQTSKLASLGQLTATLNHELVQPLNIAKLSLSNLAIEIAQGADKPALLKRLGRVSDNIQRAGQILTQFRKLARQGHDVQERFPLAEAVDSGVRMLEEQCRIDGIAVSTDIRTNTEIVANRLEFEQVIVNLLSNACEAIRQQRLANPSAAAKMGHVRIAIDDAPGTPEHVVVTIEDDGGGIPEGILARIFQPFFTTRSAAGGTGLGLAICRATVERSSGTLHAANIPNGAQFKIVLPRALAEARIA